MSQRFIKPTSVLDVLGVIGYKKGSDITPQPLRITCTVASSWVEFDPVAATHIQYRQNGYTTWMTWDGIHPLVFTLEPGEYVEFRGSNESVTGALGNFIMPDFPNTARFEASGSIMSLIYGENLNAQNNLIIPDGITFDSLFIMCKVLYTAPEFPATKLTPNCYVDVFDYCINLEAAPALPATELQEYCYAGMFQGCYALTEAPRLPAVTLAPHCYESMFFNATSLARVSVPFLDWGDDSTDQWLTDASSTGVFVCPAALDTSIRDTSHVPSGWTIETY